MHIPLSQAVQEGTEGKHALGLEGVVAAVGPLHVPQGLPGGLRLLHRPEDGKGMRLDAGHPQILHRPCQHQTQISVHAFTTGRCGMRETDGSASKRRRPPFMQTRPDDGARQNNMKKEHDGSASKRQRIDSSADTAA